MSSRGLAPRPLVLEGSPLHLVGRARIYTCGITPYDVTHLGHAATYVRVDTVIRVLRALGVTVEHCQNITDVDDVLTEAARRADTPYDEFAAIQQFAFEHDIAAIGVTPAQHQPRAHAFIPQVIELAAVLLDRGLAYEVAGTVFFRGSAVPGGAGLDDVQAAAALGEFGEDLEDPAKEHPFDSPVWRASGEGQPSWPSPWGPGRPGWHAECTAMALCNLGSSVDLHAGGADLAFPHHAYEAALAESATGVAPFVRHWLRPGVVSLAGEKMAKSTGNLVLLGTLLREHPAAAVRLAILDRPWQEPWDYQREHIVQAEHRLEALYAAGGRPGEEQAATRVVELLRNDLAVSAGVDAAIDAGGPAARLALHVLGLDAAHGQPR